MIEEELMQLSSPNPALRAASGELSKMHDKVAALESELNGERRRHESVATQLTMLQQQVRKYVTFPPTLDPFLLESKPSC